MSYDAGDRRHVKRLAKQAKLDESNDAVVLKRIMSDPYGRAWMLRNLEAGHMFSDPFTGEALTEAYNKGGRNFALRLFADVMRHCPEEYLDMMREKDVRDAANDARVADDERTNSRSVGDDTGSAGQSAEDGAEGA